MAAASPVPPIPNPLYDPALDDWDGESRARRWDDGALVLAEPGDPLVAGATIYGQFWYRDGQSPSTTGLSDAVEADGLP